MAYLKPTVRQCVEAYKNGCKNYEIGVKYLNPFPVGSRLWTMFERGFAKSLKRDAKQNSLMDCMKRGIELSKNRKRPVCVYIGKLKWAA